MKFSIIVPCYNEEKNIEKLVGEFAEKVIPKVDDIEIVLVNNGSSDNSIEIMNKLKETYNFLKIENVEKNKGYGYGILRGIRVAKGDFIGWIHADLQVHPKEILKGIQYLEKNGFSKNVFIKGRRTKRPIPAKIFTFFMSIYETIILRKKMWDINAQPTLMSKELIQKWKNPPYDYSLDLYSFYVAKTEKCKIYRYNVIENKRNEGKSSWNTGIKSKIKIIKRVLNYTKELKKCIEK